MCLGDVASQNWKLGNEDVVVVEDVCVGGDDENDDNRIDDDVYDDDDDGDYAEDDIYKLFPRCVTSENVFLTTLFLRMLILVVFFTSTPLSEICWIRLLWTI